MKAILIDKFVDNIDDTKISEVPKPKAGPDEVLVQIAAAGVNYVDRLYIQGRHQNNRSLIRPPFILGLEFAGIAITSPPHSPFNPGDRVFGGIQGSFAEFITAHASSLHHIPPTWSFADAAGLAATAPVGYGALIVRGGLKAGETVLIHAAAGGLGLMAVQIAKAVGARVIATSSSFSKLDIARSFGADVCVNYSENSEWWKEVLKETGGEGVDVVYDTVGLVDKSLKCLKPFGRILIIGFTGTEGAIEKIAMNRILLRQARIIGYVIPPLDTRAGMTDRLAPSETVEVWRGLKEMWESGKLKPTVYEKEYRGLESVPQAMKDVQDRRVWGKAVILVNKNAKQEAKL